MSSAPDSHHPVESYEHIMGTPMDPSDHEIDNIPEASDPRHGESLEMELQELRDIVAKRHGYNNGEADNRVERSSKEGTTKTSKGPTKTARRM